MENLNSLEISPQPENITQTEDLDAFDSNIVECQSKLNPHFLVNPMQSLIDEKISIVVKGLTPGQRITLKAKLTGDSNEEFESYGHFIADGAGSVCTAETPSLSGTYTGVDSMGLLWSMKLLPGQRKGQRLSKKNVTKPYYIHLLLFNGHVEDCTGNEVRKDLQPICSVTFERWYMSEGVRRIPVRNGRLRGTLFLPPGKGPFPGIIDLFGTIGGLVEFKASLLASHGFAALALAYFAYDDLPKVATELELEYFFEACDWMLAHPDVMSRGLGVMGVSKGSELALILAAHRKEVTAVVGVSPAHALIAFPLKCRGEPLAFLKFKPDLVKLSENGAMIFKESYPPDMTDGPGRAATIEVEKIQGDILLICGTDDQNWKAQEMAGKIRSRLRKYGKESRCTIHSYPGTGHLIEPPYTPTCHLSYHKSFTMCCEWGGEPRQQAFAQEDSWKHILNFFADNLSLKNKKSRL